MSADYRSILGEERKRLEEAQNKYGNYISLKQFEE